MLVPRASSGSLTPFQGSSPGVCMHVCVYSVSQVCVWGKCTHVVCSECASVGEACLECVWVSCGACTCMWWMGWSRIRRTSCLSRGVCGRFLWGTVWCGVCVVGLWGACVCPRLFVCCVCVISVGLCLCVVCVLRSVGTSVVRVASPYCMRVAVIHLLFRWCVCAGCMWGQLTAAWKGRPPGLVGPAAVGLVACCLSPPGGPMLRGSAEVGPLPSGWDLSGVPLRQAAGLGVPAHPWGMSTWVWHTHLLCPAWWRVSVRGWGVDGWVPGGRGDDTPGIRGRGGCL